MKGDHKIKSMEIVIRWETGDTHHVYSPEGKTCQSRFRKWLGWRLICDGAEVLFGGRGWEIHMNRVKESPQSTQ